MSSGGNDDAPTMKPLHLVCTINCRQNAVRAVRFNEDGNYCLTSGGDKSVKLWNPHKEEALLLKTYQGHGYEVHDARGSHDNAQILSGGADKQVLLWDVATGQILRRFRGHAGCVNAVTLNKDSSVAISASLDGTVRLWDCRSRSREPIQLLDEASDSITSVCCSDHEVLTGSADCRVRRYDIRQGMLYVDFVGKSIGSVQFSKDGQCILVSSLDSIVRLFEKGTGVMLAEFIGHKNTEYKTDCAFLNSDRQVVCGSEDGNVYCWNLLGNDVLYTLKHPIPFVISSVSAHPKDECILTACRGSVYLWKRVLISYPLSASWRSSTRPANLFFDPNLCFIGITLTSDVVDQRPTECLKVTIDFDKTDALRHRKLQMGGRTLYVCEFYLSAWSAVFSRLFSDESDQPTKPVLLNKPYNMVHLFLQCIYPTQLPVNNDNLKSLLQMADDFQSDGVRQKCMDFMRRGACTLSVIEQFQLADRYQLEPLLTERIRDVRRQGTASVIQSSHYANISDRSKVRMLDFYQPLLPNGPSDQMANTDAAQEMRFDRKSELNFATVKSRGTRTFYVNPYYVAAWSAVFLDAVLSSKSVDSFEVPITDGEFEAFLLAIYPPMQPCTDGTASVRLRAACSLRSSGLLGMTIGYVMHEANSLHTGEKLLMLDRCRLYSFIPACLCHVSSVQQLLDLITRNAYGSLSTDAKAHILDRLSHLVKTDGKTNAIN